MKKTLLLLTCILLSVYGKCLAIDHSKNLLSLINVSRETATREKITAMLGQPAKIEENKKHIWWHYTNEQSDLVICWSKKSDLFENFSFTSEPSKKTICDGQLCKQLRSGSTDIIQTIKLLGTPADMKIKGSTQELHYAYQNVAMRLFFRNRVLVDFTLLTQMGN